MDESTLESVLLWASDSYAKELINILSVDVSDAEFERFSRHLLNIILRNNATVAEMLGAHSTALSYRMRMVTTEPTDK